jgi:hypothetical protein
MLVPVVSLKIPLCHEPGKSQACDHKRGVVDPPASNLIIAPFPGTDQKVMLDFGLLREILSG